MPLILERGVPLLFPGTPADFACTPFDRLKFALSSPYGEQVRATEEQLKAHGLSLVERASCKRGAIDYSSQIARLKAADLDVVILGTIVRETASARMEARKQGWLLPLDSAEQPAAARGVIDRYKARFGKNPEDGIVFGYTSVMLFAEGAKNAGRDLTVDSLVKGLERVRNWTTAFGASPVSFSETERLGVRATMVMQARGGKFVPITPPITY